MKYVHDCSVSNNSFFMERFFCRFLGNLSDDVQRVLSVRHHQTQQICWRRDRADVRTALHLTSGGRGLWKRQVQLSFPSQLSAQNFPAGLLSCWLSRPGGIFKETSTNRGDTPTLFHQEMWKEEERRACRPVACCSLLISVGTLGRYLCSCRPLGAAAHKLGGQDASGGQRSALS